MLSSYRTEAPSAERLAFEIFLRTGDRVSPEAIQGVLETKFNPWHDPEDGRFTFANRGNFFPGGGRFGGAGATGKWDPPRRAKTPSPKPRAPARLPVPPHVPPGDARSASVSKAPLPPRLRPAISKIDGAERRHAQRNGYDFALDETDRPRSIDGDLASGNAKRSRKVQARAGGADRRPTDDGGHYIASRFNGPNDDFNHFAQDRNFNRGAYKVLEDRWAKAMRDGKTVHVHIEPYYHGESKRPYRLDVQWRIDGREKRDQFLNEPKGATNGR